MTLSYPKIKILSLLCTGIACYVGFYIANVYLLHQLSLEAFGDFAVSLKVLAIICAFITVSKQLSLSLYLPQYEKSHRNVQRHGLVLWLGKNLFLAAMILLIGIIFTTFVLKTISSDTFLAVFQAHPWQFILFFIPIISFIIVLSCLVLSQKDRVHFLAPFITIIPSLLIISIFTLGIHIFEVSSQSIVLTYLLCQGVIILLYLSLTHHFYIPHFTSNLSKDEHDQWYTYSHTYWIGTLSNQLSTLLSLIALAYLTPGPLVGEYAIILLFVTSYIALISPLHTYLASQLNLLLHTSTETLNRIISLIFRIQVLIVALCLSIVSIYGKSLLTGLHPELGFLYPHLILAMCLFGLAIITSIPLRILLHTALPDIGLYLKGSRLFLSCILLLILIPRYGIVGAIISDTLPLMIMNGIAFVFCHQKLNLRFI